MIASGVGAFAVQVHNVVIGGIFPSHRCILHELFREMAQSEGKLPERWWLKWADRGIYFDDNGRLVADRNSLFKLSGQLIFKVMIRKLVAYEPSLANTSSTSYNYSSLSNILQFIRMSISSGVLSLFV